MAREASKRQKQPNLSYFAFTATPKWKTLAVFDEAGENGKAPFHSYTMKQAIEEGFIMDVLSNYVCYEQYFKLLKISQDNKELSKNKLKSELLRFVNIHPSVISQKVEIIVEHFRTVTMSKIGGRAKAMVVTDSRKSAVQYKLAFEDYIKQKDYTGIKALVAFSGKVSLDDTGKEYTEVAMNGGIPEAKLKDSFNTDDYKVLLVAEKYQTGFDQPLLHTMFVDKRLSGVQAVQTLSRLNRTTTGKTDTFVLDFVNTHEDIHKAFKDYYTVTHVNELPDSEKLDSLATQIDEYKIYVQDEVDELVNLWLSTETVVRKNDSVHGKMNHILAKAVERYENIKDSSEEIQEENKRKFKSDVQSYINLYLFVSQIISYSDTSHEKRFIYLRALLAKLPKGSKEPKIDITKDVVLQYYKLEKMHEGAINLGEGEAGGLKGSTDVGTGKPKTISNIEIMINKLNTDYGTDFTPADRLFFDQVLLDSMDSETILQACKANSLETFTDFLFNQLDDLFFKRLEGNEEICNTINNNEKLKRKVAKHMAKELYNRQ
ncbi:MULTISPECIES: hypothetical protein [unclassified Acinetobacter]|uniref:type I restriction enzyme subunit R domain-containing protein n=1 Tax=unclassified Acinetobacter TaxID=196816 RepID=UPI0035B6C1A7